jgi:hypothetical protein
VVLASGDGLREPGLKPRDSPFPKLVALRTFELRRSSGCHIQTARQTTEMVAGGGSCSLITLRSWLGYYHSIWGSQINTKVVRLPCYLRLDSSDTQERHEICGLVPV